MDLFTESELQMERCIATRRILHQNPELAFEEHQTAQLIQQRLMQAGFEVKTGIAGTGVLGYLACGKIGPHFLLRFDMDALPIQEENDLSFASATPGKMHACGHDGHVALGLGVADLLAKHRDRLHGSYTLLFQPAEEIGQGAKAMIRAGVLESPKPDFCLGCHLWAEKPLGWIGVKEGPVMGGASDLNIEIIGKGGHGGRPQDCADPIVAASQLITALQTIVSRNCNPLDAGVLSITSIHGGTANNIIPSEVRLRGTLRWFSPQTRDLLSTRIEVLCETLVSAMSCRASYSLNHATIPVVNHPVPVKAAQMAIARALPSVELDRNYQTLLAEDFAYYGEQIPSVFLLVGAGHAQHPFPHHHPRFNVDEQAMQFAMTSLLATCEQLAEQRNNEQ